MTDEAFRHNSWATLRLLDFCRDLDPALLDASARGVPGSVKETLAQIVGEEEILAGIVEGVPAHQPPPYFTSLDDLHERARWLAERWERLLEQELHPDRLVERDTRAGERRLVRLGTVLAEVVHQGNHRRAEVGVVLRTVDIMPPALDGWAYGAWLTERSDRARRRSDAV